MAAGKSVHGSLVWSDEEKYKTEEEGMAGAMRDVMRYIECRGIRYNEAAEEFSRLGQVRA